MQTSRVNIPASPHATRSGMSSATARLWARKMFTSTCRAVRCCGENSAITASTLLEALHAVCRLDVESLVNVLDGRDAELLRQLLAAEPTSRPKSASVSGLLKM